MSGKNRSRPVQIFLSNLSECNSGQLTTQLQVVLMGDAAHTMTPILGQGLNCGLEDVAVFAQILEQHQGNVDTALPAYNTARWPDVEALLNINELMANKDYPLNPQVHVTPCVHC